MALQQHHLLSDVSVRGFVAGATNVLFRQQRHLSDAVVEVEEVSLDGKLSRAESNLSSGFSRRPASRSTTASCGKFWA